MGMSFCFGQVLLLFWCHCICHFYSLIKPGWIVASTRWHSVYQSVEPCFWLLWASAGSSVLVLYNWSHRWGICFKPVMRLWCSLPKVARVVQWMKSCSISYSKVEFPICTALSSLSKASTKFCMWPSSGILLISMGVVPCFFEVWNFFGCTADCWTPVLRLSRPGAALTTLKPAQCIETF